MSDILGQAEPTAPRRGRPPKVQPVSVDTVTCVIMRDWWDADGDRHRAGKLVDLPVLEAMDKVEAGIVSRFKG